MNNLNLKNSCVLSNALSKWSSRFFLGFGLVTAMTTASAAVIESEFNGTFATADFADPGLNSGIIGDLSAASNDVDIWKFDLTAGAGFGASITNGSATDFGGVFDINPIIVLYMENAGNYYAVAGNNPDAFSSSFGFTAWESGTYFLTVSADFNSPEDAFGNNGFDSQFWTSQFFGLSTPFSGFEGNSFTSFDYNLTLTGAVTTSVVPVPAAAWLFASGLLGLLGFARRSQRIA
ncbi:MAG: hypothetical protein COA54_09965 [Thiotrichaceae bacterium]|nr:MAG: hypothetical protein COA54_09965 [Thiotrichaceae bacterium]